MKKIICILSLLVIFSTVTHAAGKSSTSMLIGVGNFMDKAPMPLAKVKVMSFSFFWEREFIKRRFFAFGIMPGIQSMSLLPVPAFEIGFKFLPQPMQAFVKTGMMYDFIYGNMFSLTAKVGVLVHGRVNIEAFIIYYGTQPENIYPKRIKDSFDPIQATPGNDGVPLKLDKDGKTIPFKSNQRDAYRDHPGFVNYPLIGISINVRI